MAAVLFGASFPLSKVLLRDVSPQVLAGIFYLASGLGTGALWWFMTATMGRAQREAPLQRRDWGWLAAATVSGGVIGPVLLLLGVARTPAHVSALLANSETVFTALFAVLFFGDFLLRREVFGIGLIVLGAVSVAFVV